MKSFFRSTLIAVFSLACLLPLLAQDLADEGLVGLTLREVIEKLGVPDYVSAVRGAEVWQDDVVFVYGAKKLDIYFYKDRVWQVGVTEALGIKKGARKTDALAALSKNGAEDRGSFILHKYADTVYPKYARFNIDAAGRVDTIYVYRPDY